MWHILNMRCRFIGL